MMKRTITLILLLCLLAALLSGCSGALPSLPSLPAAETPASEPTPEPEIEPTPEPFRGPERLKLGFTLPSVEDSPEDLRFYFSPAAEFDCAFCYPAYCAAWAEKGAVRLSPSWFFARLFFTSVEKENENAPDALLDLLEPGKWGTVPNVGTAGSGWGALRAAHLKYDTWRRWVAWETSERYCLLYGVCFDGREGEVGTIFDIVSESFLTSAELLSSAPESGELLRQDDALSLSFDGAELRGEYPVYTAELRLSVTNEGDAARELYVDSLSLDGTETALDARCRAESGESLLWTLSLPIAAGEDGVLCRALSLRVSACGEDGAALFELPVDITLD